MVVRPMFGRGYAGADTQVPIRRCRYAGVVSVHIDCNGDQRVVWAPLDMEWCRRVSECERTDVMVRGDK